MFRPIKNFITYIQKNASGSSIFGSTVAVSSEGTVPDEEVFKELENVNTETMDAAVIDPSLYETDLEQHIKSCVIPLKNGKLAESLVQNHDHNQNHAKPFERGGCDDLGSVESEEPPEDVETIEKFTAEDEGVEDQFQDASQDIEESFPDPEIIVLNDDLTSSIASETPSEDPLAIDDFPTSSVKESSTLLECNTSDNGDLLWMNLDQFKGGESIEDMPQQSSPHEKLQRPNEILAKVDETTSTKCSSNEEQGEELRSEGSDSGLGSETSTLQITINSLTDKNQIARVTTTTPCDTPQENVTEQPVSVVATRNSTNAPVELLVKVPLRSNLKRRLDDSLNSTVATTDIEVAFPQKKPKRSINFDTVQVYYFPRQQGFGCVPSAGGCTLGMSTQHISSKTLTLAEHAAEIRRAHRLQLQEINPRGSSSDDSEESEEDYLSEGSGSDLDADMNGFLQPVSPKQRRALLKAAGVRKIDASEKADCRDIRNSREVCGCTCRDFCDPETCSCNQAGIKCQVDRSMFPCGCSRDACGNTVGRVEFNPTRVRTHYIHTIMRLEMENRQQQNPTMCSNAGSINYSSSSTTSATVIHQTNSHGLANNNYYNMQSQSNYSSGYASPAYSCEQTANYYQQQTAAPHFGSLPTQDIHQVPQYPLDALDAGLFAAAPSATPAYGELMPNFSSSSTAYHNMSYSTMNDGMQTQVSAFSSYSRQTSSTSFLPPTHPTIPTTYSSCAVPSAPPYGAATVTTAVTPQYLHHSNNSISLEAITPSCAALDPDDNNFISLNSPIASSPRLSQINDLLQHNRNATSALVAVDQNLDPSGNSLNGDSMCGTAAISDTASMNMPPIQDTQKNCIVFSELQPPLLNVVPIVAVLENSSIVKSLATESPPHVEEELVYKSCVSTESAAPVTTTPAIATSIAVDAANN